MSNWNKPNVKSSCQCPVPCQFQSSTPGTVPSDCGMLAIWSLGTWCCGSSHSKVLRWSLVHLGGNWLFFQMGRSNPSKRNQEGECCWFYSDTSSTGMACPDTLSPTMANRLPTSGWLTFAKSLSLPSTNLQCGLAEAFNKTLCNLLSKVAVKSKRDWHKRLGEAL